MVLTFYEDSKRELPRDGINNFLGGILHTYERTTGSRYVGFKKYIGGSQLISDRHENVADLLGTPCRSFKQMNEDKATDIMRTIHEYIKTVQATIRSGAGTGAGAGPANATHEIATDPEGFPIVPSPPSWDKMTKAELEILYRQYITLHYRMSVIFWRYAMPFTFY